MPDPLELDLQLQASDGGTPVDVVATAGGKLIVDTELAASLASSLTELQSIVAALAGTLTVTGTQTDALTDAELRASSVAVADDYASGETLADQSPSASVVTFTFSAPVRLVVVYPAADTVCRADPFGGTPSATQGIPLLADAPNFLPVTTSTVAVFGDTGPVSVWGFA